MKIYHHWVTATARSLTDGDVNQLFALLGIPTHLCNKFTAKSGTTVYTWKAPYTNDTESVSVAVPAHALFSTITLRGTFFNTYPDFPMHRFYQWIQSKSGNVKKLDISYEDEQQILDFAEIRSMCSLDNFQDFLTGTCVNDRRKNRGEIPDSKNRAGVPDVHANHDLIHFGDVNSPTCAKAYVMPSGHTKFELTLNDKAYNHALLDLYDPENIGEWERQAKAALVKCVNFVRPSSRKSKRLVQVDSWEKFLGSQVKPIRWTDYTPTQDIETLTFEQSLSRNIGQLQNMCRKFRIYDDVEDSIRQLSDKITNAYDQLQQLGVAFA